ncbi:hypothetical protein G4V62_05695 [Bacillaceae bacterium SIJ1]|uniref:hypothetical protein n=1 Tax=Litoribacterium kuwaitense TaxID=1398745 RepID=UPI0013EB5EBC|nr:hypothetical protein [Litoribacterium kuwaitense]NGP44475.1 hypothetical protein [Litoribacterium kuwaitense]
MKIKIQFKIYACCNTPSPARHILSYMKSTNASIKISRILHTKNTAEARAIIFAECKKEVVSQRLGKGTGNIKFSGKDQRDVDLYFSVKDALYARISTIEQHKEKGRRKQTTRDK